MQPNTDRTIAILAQALAVCRGIMYSARTGDASQQEIEELLTSTSQESLVALMGLDTYYRVIELMEALPASDREHLLGIRSD
jgi:hypothetical protein